MVTLRYLFTLCCIFSLLPLLSCSAKGTGTQGTTAVTPEPKSTTLRGIVTSTQAEPQRVTLLHLTGTSPKRTTLNINESTEGIRHPVVGSTVVAHISAAEPTTALSLHNKKEEIPMEIPDVSTYILLRVLTRNSSTVLIDSRPHNRYLQGTIPGARSVPLSALQQNGVSLLPDQKARPLVFFCENSGCTLAGRSAQYAHEQGYTNVHIYSGGVEEWQQYGQTITVPQQQEIDETLDSAKLSIAQFNDILCKAGGNGLFIDVRSAAEFNEKTFIKNVINIPAGKILEHLSTLPRTQHLYLYSSNGVRARLACRQLLDNGFQVFYLAGPIDEIGCTE